jgi:hypothetical protein
MVCVRAIMRLAEKCFYEDKDSFQSLLLTLSLTTINWKQFDNFMLLSYKSDLG